jgi:nitroreductase
MEVINAILTRRSIRKYTKERVTDKQIKILLKAAMYAPSAMNQQPWHFIVIENREKLNRIMEVHPFSLISIGYPAEKKPVPQRFKPERIHKNT